MNKTEDCVHIVSHGTYLQTGDTFTVPPNIVLWQYSPPGTIMSLLEATYIVRQGCSVVEPFYLIQRNNGTVFSSTYKATSIQPGTKTKDLQLDFTVNEFEGFTMGINSSTGYLEIPTERKVINLSTLLNKISSKIPAGVTLPVIQLSCRAGTYTSFTPDKDELIRAIDKCNRKTDFLDMLYLNVNHKVAFDPTNFFLTKDTGTAKTLSCLINDNFPLYNFKTVEDITATLDEEDMGQSGGRRRINKRIKDRMVKTKKKKNRPVKKRILTRKKYLN